MIETIFSLSTLYFFLISLVNVILSSSKSICVVRYGVGINVIMNVVAYSFYNVVVKQTANLPLSTTVLSTAAANAIGVWLSYVVLNRFQTDRVWKIEVLVPKCYTEKIHYDLHDICHHYVESGPKTVFNCYCETRAETKKVLEQRKKYKGKIFAFESKFKGIDRD